MPCEILLYNMNISKVKKKSYLNGGKSHWFEYNKLNWADIGWDLMSVLLPLLLSSML